MLTKGAIGNLVNRYRAVLKTCRLINTFGSLAVAGMLVMGGASMAYANHTEVSTDVAVEGKTFSEIETSGNGGVYRVYNGGTLTVKNSTFKENSATGWGGAIVSNAEKKGAPGGTLNISGSTFENNKSDQMGGAIGADSNSISLTIDSSTFKNNHAKEDGGAVGSYHVLTITNSVFDGNTAQLAQTAEGEWTGPVNDSTPVGGGALSLGAISDARVASITDTVFKNNKSGKNGGAIGTRLGKDATNAGAKLNIAATFDGNRANWSGGAFYNTFYHGQTPDNGDGVTLSGIFTRNSAGKSGGAIYNDGSLDKTPSTPSGGVMTISDSTFTGNMAETENGGAIYNSGTLNFAGTNTFTDNTANGTPNDIYNISAVTITGGTTTLNSGYVQDDGTVFQVDGSTPINTTPSLTVASGATLNTSTLDIKAGAATVVGTLGILTGGTASVATGSTLTIGGTANVAGTLATSGAVAVSSGGTLTATSLNVADGTVTIGGTANADNLTLSGGALTVNNAGTLVSKSTTWTDGGTGKLAIDSGGTATLAETDVLGAYDGTAYAAADQIADSGNPSLVDAGKLDNKGSLILTRTETYTSAQLKAAQTAVGGNVSFLGAAMDLDPGEQLFTEGQISPSDPGSVTLDMSSTSLYVGNQTTGSSGGAQEIGSKTMPDNIVNVVVSDGSGGGTNKLAENVSTITVNNGSVTAQALQVASAAGNTVELVADGSGGTTNVTLVGSNGSVIVAEDGTQPATNLKATNNATLNLGIKGNLNPQAITVNNLTADNGGTVVLQGNGANTDAYAVTGTLTTGDAPNSGKVEVYNSVLTVNTLDMSKGGTLFVDPAYVSADNLQGTLNGSLYVGDGSTVSINMEAATLREALTRAGIPVGNNMTLDRKSALALGAPVTLGTKGKIVVDPGVDTTGAIGGAPAIGGNSGAYFGADSVLVAPASIMENGSAALTGDGSTSELKVENGASLIITDATGGDYVVAQGFQSSTVNGWNDVSSSSFLQDAAIQPTTDGAVVSIAQKNAAEALPGISSGMAGLVESMYANGLNSVDAPNAGAKFVSRATDARFSTRPEAAKLLESAGQLSVLGGAPLAAFDAASVTSEAIHGRAGMGSPMSRMASMSSHSFGVWAMPMYRSTRLDGQKAGNFHYGVDSNLYGGSIGADMNSGNFRYGLALSVGGGDTESSGGDLRDTENDFDFWGVTAYAGWKHGNFSLTGELGYTSMDNDIDQDMPADLGGKLHADVDADLYRAGLTAAYRIPTALVDITPSVGVRYNAYRQDAHAITNRDGDVFNVDSADMDTWSFPIMVNLSRDITAGGWVLQPSVNVGVIPVAGDKSLDTSVRLPGLIGVRNAGLSGEVFDDTSLAAGAALNVAKDNISFGLDYGFQGSSDVKSHRVFGTFRYEF